MNIIHCPQCGSAGVHRSRRRSRAERIATLAGGSVRRCHDCNLRFLHIGGSLVRVDSLGGLARRVSLTVWLALATATVLSAILWWDRASLPDTHAAHQKFFGESADSQSVRQERV